MFSNPLKLPLELLVFEAFYDSQKFLRRQRAHWHVRSIMLD